MTLTEATETRTESEQKIDSLIGRIGNYITAKTEIDKIKSSLWLDIIFREIKTYPDKLFDQAEHETFLLYNCHHLCNVLGLSYSNFTTQEYYATMLYLLRQTKQKEKRGKK